MLESWSRYIGTLHIEYLDPNSKLKSKLFSRITVPIIMLVDFVIDYASLMRATMATPQRVSGVR